MLKWNSSVTKLYYCVTQLSAPSHYQLFDKLTMKKLHGTYRYMCNPT